MDSTVFLFPTLENLKLVTRQRLLDWPRHYPALAGGAAHEKDHVVLGRVEKPLFVFPVAHGVNVPASGFPVPFR